MSDVISFITQSNVQVLSIGKSAKEICDLEVEYILNGVRIGIAHDVSEVEANLKELYSSLNHPSTSHVLVEGFAATGKSTLVRSIIESGHLKGFRVILQIQLLPKVCKKLKELSDIAEELNISLSKLKSCIDDAPGDVLIILDGVSELIHVDNWEKSVLARIITEKEFPNATKLLLTRPSGTMHILNSVNVGRIFRLKGMSEASLKVVVSQSRDERVIKLLDEHAELLSICQRIPLVANLLCQLFELNKKHSNLTITDILIHATIEMIKQRLQQLSLQVDKIVSLFSLPEETFDDFSKLSKFAFHSLASSHLMATLDEKERFVSGFSLNHSFSLVSSETFGFVESSLDCFEFVHPLVHEFLAGYHVQLLPPLDELQLIRKHAFDMLDRETPSTYWLKFFFGLTWRRKLTFDPAKYMISTLLEFLVHCLVTLQKSQNRSAILTLVNCVLETRDNDLWKKLASNLGGSIPLQINVKEFEEHTMMTLANMINCSGIQDWSVTASNFKASKHLQNFDIYTSVRMSKVVVHDMEQTIHISPKLSAEAASKRQKDFERFSQCEDKEAAFMNQFQCKAIREILQRIFKIYSEIKLKGDASNPAYVSFLSCHCFKDKLKENLLFDPPLPYHFLDVTSEKTLKKIQEEHRIHMASHGGKAVELVILIKPFVRRVTITIPHTSEKHRIVFVSEELAHSIVGEGTISSSLSSSDSIQGVLDKSITETVSTSSSEMVRPALPLPNTQSLRATTVLPQVTSMGTVQVTMPHNIMHEELEPEKRHRQLRVHKRESQSRSKETEMGNKSDGSSLSTRLSNFYCHPPVASEHQQTATITPTQQTLHPRSTIKEGTVLFTSISKQIPADQIHPLPDETHQMRRGGNGQIFKGTIGGMDVVFKKTNYRSKEYAIITKIKHKNIVPLLAFMYGAENPAHKRRHFCYHIMPRLSGDCARMLTDKENLTIKELSREHGDDTRKMGVIRGNLKYLLREVLEGLRYLHSLHIAHRDIKGSNVLLNFFCPCTNPLECGCDTKYQVLICDFDAATQLNDSEQLQPTQIRTRHTSLNHYICVPVGTNGFRSPECSMPAVANSPDSFSPPITTRCDIWSLGILTVRILIGVTGPSRQREMALLLLHYHNERYMHEGIHRPGYLQVDRLVTDKLLNVSTE